MKALLRRWFVEYNPLYLLSAALVLRGVNMISRALLDAGHVYAQLGGAAIAEAYAWALIGAAALSMRIGLRRPAVMLALLAVVYQGDITLHTETCAWLGRAGWLASAVWLASFALKLVALARAMRLRPSRSAYAVPMLGAAGFVLVPRIVAHASTHDASVVVAAFVFAIASAALSTERAIAFEGALDAWGRTVLRRAVMATWAIWAALGALHVAFWFSSRSLEPAALGPVLFVLGTRVVRREWQAWAAIALTLSLVYLAAPPFFAFAATLSAVAFVLRAVRARSLVPIAGALFAVHLGLWTMSWSGGAFPAHSIALDVALAAAVALVASQSKVRAPLLGLAAVAAHFALQTRIVTAPTTPLAWGVWSTVSGFVLLVAAVVLTLQLQRNRYSC